MTSLWARRRLKSPASRLFTQAFIQGADQRKHQSSASLAFVRWPVNSPHKGPVTRKMFPFDDVIMRCFVVVMVLFLVESCDPFTHSLQSSFIDGDNLKIASAWRRHQMEKFSALPVLYEGNPPVTGAFPSHKGRWHVSLMFSLICAWTKRLSKHSRRRWFETPSCSLWRHCNVSSSVGYKADRYKSPVARCWTPINSAWPPSFSSHI